MPKKVPEPVHLRAKVISISGSGNKVFERDEYSLGRLLQCDRFVVHSSKLRQLTKTDRPQKRVRVANYRASIKTAACHGLVAVSRSPQRPCST